LISSTNLKGKNRHCKQAFVDWRRLSRDELIVQRVAGPAPDILDKGGESSQSVMEMKSIAKDLQELKIQVNANPSAVGGETPV
jgi:hypothetical protein